MSFVVVGPIYAHWMNAMSYLTNSRSSQVPRKQTLRQSVYSVFQGKEARDTVKRRRGRNYEGPLLTWLPLGLTDCLILLDYSLRSHRSHVSGQSVRRRVWLQTPHWSKVCWFWWDSPGLPRPGVGVGGGEREARCRKSPCGWIASEMGGTRGGYGWGHLVGCIRRRYLYLFILLFKNHAIFNSSGCYTKHQKLSGY